MQPYLELAGWRTAHFFHTNKDGTESSFWAGLPILLTPPSILITVNGFFASVSLMLRRVWVAFHVVKSFGEGQSLYYEPG